VNPPVQQNFYHRGRRKVFNLIIMRIVKKWFQLSGQERRYVLAATIYLALISLGLKIFGYRRCLAFITNRSQVAVDTSLVGEDQLQAMVTSFRRVTNTLRMGKCLSRSLAMHAYLQGYGIGSQVRIGVSKEEAFEAHAWVEYRGVPLGEVVDLKYRSMGSLEPLVS
jgi:hypothetical protein